jgi:25S rRNA (uracil2843-N3)-methyltransferase
MMFTLNELFTSGGIGKTTRLLLDLTSSVPIGSLLLVVDSPGSYSETTLGKEAKRYPMQWLLDRIMLGTQKDPVGGRKWKKLESEDSVWCRLSEKLEYPIRLENMRYQLHLYKAEDATSTADEG